MLGWSRNNLSRSALIKLDVIEQAEERDGSALLTYGQEIAIRRVCGQAGVEFVDRPPIARLREVQPDPAI
ncbi:hypothetical protein D3273_25170 [Lichenibacterium minor]|uniref:Uncharacterized protein n=1 Tax=Lichenibacterium minor TaxID=2316528 RepID=A0A4Q2TYL9_9HYPH|nr:hypothetical protein [Lichenibacterium minor]RYC29212.1 hypothetical protein D3273_25170 [Lichenibacterium minor]